MKNNDNGETKLPPHDLEAERGVLGCILIDAGAAMAAADPIAPAAFYDLRHRTIYENLLAMHDERIPIDMLTVMSRLRDRKELEKVGGVAYLGDLPEAAPTPLHTGWYSKIVADKARLRRIIRTGTELVSKAYDAGKDDDIEDAIDEAEQAILKLGESSVDKSLPKMSELVQRAMSTIEDYHARQGIITGLSTGFPDLDKLTCGLQKGDMIVIAARPSMGKTALAVQIAEGVAIEQQLPVGIFSLEMTADSLSMRMLCSRARVNLRSVREGFLAERDIPKLTGAAAKIAAAPIHIDDASTLSIFQLRTKARRMAAQLGVKLFVVDYLQLLHSSSRKADNRQQEIADVSRGLKALAKELNVPIIVLSQLNREVERDGKRRPRLSDLRESGAIEQDADFVGLLYRPAEDDDDQVHKAEVGPVNLYIAKQRNGPALVDVNLTFLRGYTRFESAAKVAEQDKLPHKD